MKTFDDGLLTIYCVINNAVKGDKPRFVLKEKSKHYFRFETISYNRFYAAKQVMQQIDGMVSIWQDRTILADDVCIIDDTGEQFKISLVQQTYDDGLGITRLTLERIDEAYEFIN